VVLFFSSEDVILLKQQLSLFQDKSSSFVLILTDRFEYFIRDMNENIVQADGDGMRPIQTSNFTPDSTSPKLTRYNVDMITGRVTLSFDEAVDYTTLNYSQITFQRSEGATSEAYTLTGGTFVGISQDLRVLEFEWTEADKLQLKLIVVRINDLQMYLSLTENTIHFVFEPWSDGL
jgi:hypothetical protein